MNKIIVFAFFIFILNEISYGQILKVQDGQTLTFDLINSTTYPRDFYFKKGARMRYKIENFNRNVYTITVNSEVRILFADKPPIFNLITNIDLTKLSTGLPAAPAAAAIGVPLSTLNGKVDLATQALIATYKADLATVFASISGFNAKYSKLKRMNSFYAQLNTILLDGTHTFIALNTEKLSKTNALLVADYAYAGPPNDENGMGSLLGSNGDALFQGLDKDYDDLSKKTNTLKNELLLINKTADGTITTLEKNRDAAAAANKLAIQADIDMIKFEIVYQNAVVNGINDLMGDIKTAQTKIAELEQGGFVQQVALVYRKITQPNFEYISPSIKAQKDQVVIKMDIEPKDGALFTPNYAQFNNEYTGNVYGFKINFSTGIFIIGGKKIFDQSYRVDPIPGDNDNNVIVKNKSKQKVQPAVGALMHFYLMKPGWFSWGGALGFSVSSETRLNYHGGLSFLFGQEQRIILSLGPTLSQVKEISDEYTEGQKIPKSLNLATVPTSNFYRWGYFFAFTYNLNN